MNIRNIVTPRRILRLLPVARWWLLRTNRKFEPRAVTLSDAGFNRLGDYFSQERLASSKFVVQSPVPLPPFTRLAMKLFADGDPNLDPAGITYNNTYYMTDVVGEDESIHFHELIHVIQWDYLGIDLFNLAYTIGFLRDGYIDSPLEDMAYRHQYRFMAMAAPYDVEAEIIQEIEERVRPDIRQFM